MVHLPLKNLTVFRLLAGMILLFAVSACGSRQPAVVDETQTSPTTALSHQNFKTNCADCHEQDRKPAAVDLVSTPHGLGADCAECHAFPLFKNINTQAKAHNPPPKQCLGCHDLVTESAPHAAHGECAACHQFGANWDPK